MRLIYDIPVELNRTCLLEFQQHVNCPEQTRYLGIATLPVMRSVSTTLNILCQIIENNTIKNSIHNVQPIRISENDSNK